ncbi:DUF2971 domain-containing protein [Paraburkholderia aspalathi]|uniref:FAD-NAD(P)-binding n=1 Tax=Paraburkholderia aspalathi TaxID=1324617 RepID=A0A1I7EHQ2_9BURK|nr:DUF2971 domain-containing protein [Paraburkholderia aspalathi]SFU23439.1 hypothetical protein SAMN05192563_10214 [Paraburkholderia aspalathi]
MTTAATTPVKAKRTSKTLRIAVIGGGPKAAALAAKAAVLRELKKADVQVTIFEPDQIGAAWTGESGYTDGEQRLCTIAERDVGYRTAKPVSYVADTPRLVDEEFLSDMLSGRTSFNVKSLFERLVYTKSVGWSYEREWRIYSGNGRRKDAPHEDLRFGSFELDAVLFGLNISDEDRSSLTQLVRKMYPHAELLRARKNPDAFGMIFASTDD